MAFRYLVNWHGLGAAATSSNQTQVIAQAIAKAEGFGASPTNIPTSRNNPGNIKDASGNIIQYATPQQGWDALYNQVNLMISGQSAFYSPDMTWNQIAALYVTGNPGSSGGQNWANNVSSTLGVDPNSTLGDYLSGGGSTAASLNPLTTGATTAGTTDQTSTDQSATSSTFDWTWLLWGGAAAVVVYFLMDAAEG